MNNRMEENICEAIELIVDKKMDKAEFDKTIIGIIDFCVDATTGKYKIKYQDSVFYAYSNNIEIQYQRGESVYILIPNNDFSQEKTILSSVKKKGSLYIENIPQDNKFSPVGHNLIKSDTVRTEDFNEQNIFVIYDDTDKMISETEKLQIRNYLNKSTYFYLGATFKTKINDTINIKENFGLIAELVFQDNDTKTEVVRDYILNIDDMQGSVYDLSVPQKQYKIFQIDGKNFLYINRLLAFTEEFEPDDSIEISNIELIGQRALSQDDLNGCVVEVDTPQGSIFKGDNSSLSAIANIKIKGQLVDLQEQNIQFYWFKENLLIDQKNYKFNSAGGIGWECLNPYNIVKKNGDTIEQVDWISNSNILTINKNFVLETEATFKCVAVIDNAKYSTLFTIQNVDGIKIELDSKEGHIFYYDNGHPDLTCSVSLKAKNQENFKYYWGKEDNLGVFQNIDNSIEQTNYLNAIEEYENAKNAILEGTVTRVEGQADLDTKKNKMLSAGLKQRTDKNHLYSIEVNKITNYNIFKCGVADAEGNYLGTASYMIENRLKVEGTYSLLIENGAQTFKYDACGLSPSHPSKRIRKQFKNLTFSLYDNLGRKINIDNENVEIEWKIPKKNTLLFIKKQKLIDSNYSFSEDEDFYYTNPISLEFFIKDFFSTNNANNDIELTVFCRGLKLKAKTSFNFIKEKNENLDTVEYSCRLELNTVEEDKNTLPCIIVSQDEQGKPQYLWNFRNPDGEKFFVGSDDYDPVFFKLYKNGREIFSTQEGDSSTTYTVDGESDLEVSTHWSILKNHYGKELEDNSNLILAKVNETSEFRRILYNDKITEDATNKPICNLLRVEVKCLDGKEGQKKIHCLYKTLPIPIIKIDDPQYDIELVKTSGFQEILFTKDGKNPSYNNKNSFKLKVYKNIYNNDELLREEISYTSKNSPDLIKDFRWQAKGSYYKKENSDWHIITSDNLICKNAGNNVPIYKNLDDAQKDTVLADGTNIFLLEENRVFQKTENGIVQIPTVPPNESLVQCKLFYDGFCVSDRLYCEIFNQQGVRISSISIPIYLKIDNEGLTSLNGWDGNSVSINKEGGVVLTPQIGTGTFDGDGNFSGLLMGESRENGQSRNGILGYFKGIRTLLLDANKGRLESQAGNIGGWEITPTNLKYQGESTRIEEERKTITDSIVIGAQDGIRLERKIHYDDPTIADEKVYTNLNVNGTLESSSADIAADFREGSTVGGWSVYPNENILVNREKKDPNTNRIVLDSANGAIKQEKKMPSGEKTNQWILSEDGKASFDNITLKNVHIGEESLSEWVKNEAQQQDVISNLNIADTLVTDKNNKKVNILGQCYIKDGNLYIGDVPLKAYIEQQDIKIDNIINTNKQSQKIDVPGKLFINGEVWVKEQSGQTGSITFGEGETQKILTFVNGICVGGLDKK